MVFDVMVVGSASVDVFIKTDARVIEIKGICHGDHVDERLLAYPLGSKILVQQLALNPGGAGTNACATFARLGLDTAYIGRIGKDLHGQTLLDWLDDSGITFLGQIGGQTGYSIILSSQADDRTILSFKGCNNDLEFSQLSREKLKGKWLYGTSMLERSFTAQKKLFISAKENGRRTAFNPNPYLCSRGFRHLNTLLENTDVLILNKEEAGLLVGPGKAVEMAEKLSRHGPSIVTVSDGAHGPTIFTDNEQWHIMPASDLRIEDTTGAGDAFGSGFVAGLIMEKTIKDAALMGVLNAEDVIQAIGAKAHIADRMPLEQRLKSEQQNPQHQIRKL
jgi:ribokinase